MRRVTVQNAFQVLSIFYLFVTCFCSSLNIDANVKGVLPSESLSNDSFPASHVNKKNSEERKISSQLPNIASNDGSPKVLENEKAPGSEQAVAQPEATVVKAVLDPAEAAPSADAATNASDASVDGVAPSPPASSEVKKDSETAPSSQPIEGKGPTVETSTVSDPVPSEPPKEAAQQQEKPAVVRADAENVTTRDREGDTPEDGSDVPTFDEYQRKFTSGGSPAKEGGGGKSGAPGDVASRLEGDAAKVKDAGGGKATGGGATGGSGSSRQQSFKNIGSYNCGAKVISHNNEASNPAYVLNENRDEYMNNPCAVKKWIVVETCEPVRLRKIEMASYELFSSMVKTFRVSSSERFPQKMWDVVGTFVAKNEKGVQTYATEQDKYYKYFKFEFVDHYGNEHFCPVSLIRLFGVLMEDDDGEEEAPDDQSGAPETGGVGSGGEDEAAAMVRVGKSKEPASRSLLQSAKEVIVGIVQNTLRPSSSSKEGSSEASAASNATANVTGVAANVSTEPPAMAPRAAVEGPRVMHLMRLLLSGDYSALLQRCLELLRRAPPIVHQNYVEHKVIPSPSVAYAACAKAMAQSKISAEELRWAYLTFNNDTFPWEDTGGSAAITAKLSEPQGSEKTEEPPSSPPAQPPAPPEAPPKVAKPSDEPRSEEKPPVKPVEAKLAAGETPNGAEETGKAAVDPPKLPDAPKETKGEKGAEEPVLVDAKPQLEQPSLPPSPPPSLPPTSSQQSSQQSTETQAAESQRSVEKPPAAPSEAQTNFEAAAVRVPPAEQKLQPETQKEQEPPHQKEQQQKEQKEQQPPPPKEQQQQPPAKQHQKAASGEGSNGRGVGLKENAYMRISNKVRDLERNITISMGYLDELSRSYKKKTDKLSKQQEKTSNLLDETRSRVEKQEQRILELEAQVKALRETYEAKGLAELRREHARMGKETLVQVLALNLLVIVLHCLVLFLCRRRCRRPSAVAVNGAAASARVVRSSVTVDEDAKEEPWPLSHSNSDSNLCIVDPPFRFDDNLVKKDSKKRRKKKRSNAGVHPIPDRSASVSRIEQLIM